MALPCVYTYNGKKYSYKELFSLFHNGELVNLSNNGILSGLDNIPNELISLTENEATPRENIESNGNIRPTIGEVAEV